MKKLSDLEMAILGIVGKKAPCTSYSVAKEFSSSPSSHWRGSAGAVYPAVMRLHRLGLLKRQQAAPTARRSTLYALSTKGRARLRLWLRPPLPDQAVSITFDPLRTRAFFLGMLTPAEQLDFAQDAEQRLLRELPRLEAECVRYRESGDWFSEQAQYGTILVTQARLAWIRHLQQELKRQPPSPTRTAPPPRKGR